MTDFDRRRQADPSDDHAQPSDVSVVIATFCRPDVLRTCLEHLQRQTESPREIVVVDASPDEATRQVVANFPTVRYARNDAGRGTLPLSRRIGVEETSGTVIAFLDDDAFADPDWLFELAGTYAPGVGGVGGRARNDQPGEETLGRDKIGRFCDDGTLTGFFGADPGQTIQVDHVIGCNMSFRRKALEESGGVPTWPAGVSGVREDLLLSLRVRAAGWTLLFNPRAAVLHVGAPQVVGRRFDLRYEYTTMRNHVFVLATHLGPGAPTLRRYAKVMAATYLRGMVGSITRTAVGSAGAIAGLVRALRFRDPNRGTEHG